MTRSLLTAAALGLLALGCASAPTAAPSASGGGTRLYVANEASGVVSVVDPESGAVEVVDLRALGYGPDSKPHHVAVEPDGSHWYVSLIARNRVLKFDRANRLVDSVAFEVPGLMALGPRGDALWVGRSMSAVNAPQRLGRIDPRTMEIEEFDVFVPMPHAIATDPSGRWVFTGSMHENTLVRLEPDADQAELIRLPGEQTMAHGLVHYAVSPDGRTLVSTAEHTGRLLVFDVSSPPAMTLLREIQVGAQPWYPSFSPDGREVWFGNLGADEVTVVDASTWRVSQVIRGDGIAEPHGMTISPDGRRVYLTNRNTSGAFRGRGGRFGEAPGTLVVIDRASREILKVIELPPYGAGVGMAGGR